jgi:TolB-like protein/tetratricopeptide (TPR) repeat protein
MTDVFLSYNREDQPTAHRFAQAFEREGFKVWWDATLRSGEAYDQVTEQALRDAKAVVVLWSKKSVVSRWVRAEATLADRNRTLVPAMIEPCERPIMFELTQTADLSHWTGEANDKAWASFLADVRRFVGAGGAAPVAPMPPQVPAAASAGPQPPRDDRPSLAILPFTNRSGERADDVFADGMVEDLISALSLSGGIKVIAQSATMTYRRNVSDLRTIGRELGVRYLLEGNVRRVGANLRVTAQLVEAENAAILWSQKFDRPLTDLAALQEQLVTEVAGHLGVQVERAETEKALKKPGDLTAWEAVMRSAASGAGMTGDGLSNAIVEARKAVAIAPEYALGHAALGEALALANWYGNGGRDEAMTREARIHAERALALDASHPVVLSLAAEVLCLCRSWREGLRCAQRAVDLNPNIATSHAAMIMSCMYFKRPDEVIAHLDAYAVLAPRDHTSHVRLLQRAGAHFMAGRYEQALQAVEQSLLLNPNFMFALKDVAIYSEKLGLYEEAREAIRRLRAVEPGTTLELWEARSRSSLLAPDMAAEMHAIFSKVWLDTPEGPPAT